MASVTCVVGSSTEDAYYTYAISGSFPLSEHEQRTLWTVYRVLVFDLSALYTAEEMWNRLGLCTSFRVLTVLLTYQ